MFQHDLAVLTARSCIILCQQGGKTFLFYYRKDTSVVYESPGDYEEFVKVQDNPSYEKVYL